MTIVYSYKGLFSAIRVIKFERDNPGLKPGNSNRFAKKFLCAFPKLFFLSEHFVVYAPSFHFFIVAFSRLKTWIRCQFLIARISSPLLNKSFNPLPFRLLDEKHLAQKGLELVFSSFLIKFNPEIFAGPKNEVMRTVACSK